MGQDVLTNREKLVTTLNAKSKAGEHGGVAGQKLER
jgi:hypothetical protein